MDNARLWVVALAFTVGCGSSDRGAPTDGAGGIVGVAGANAGIGGSATALGGSGAQASAGNGGRPPNPDAGGSASGGSNAGQGNAGGGSAGLGAGASSSGGANASSGSGGKPATGGAGSCVQNLGCKLQAPASSGDLHQDCVDRINQFRTQCACLPPLSRSMDGESCADQMAAYDAAKNTAHAGYTDKICQPSGAQNSCPGYSSNNQVISLCMQQMWDEGPPPTNPCDGDCFQKYGHFINMTSTSTTKVACGFSMTSAGKVWSVQNFLH